MIETTGEGKSAVATPDGKSRKKKKKTDEFIAIRDELPMVYRARARRTFRNIVTSGHVISGRARFGTAQLHYCKLLCTGSSHGKSVQDSNSLLFTTLKTV